MCYLFLCWFTQYGHFEFILTFVTKFIDFGAAIMVSKCKQKTTMLKHINIFFCKDDQDDGIFYRIDYYRILYKSFYAANFHIIIIQLPAR